MKQSVDRLIRSFKPSNYVLSIDQDSDKMIFSGTVEISGTLTSKTDSITMHSDGLELTNTTINEMPAVVSYSPDEQTVTIQTQIVCDDIVIKTDFNGVITKPMHGLYPCFFDHDGVEKRLLATQFESHHAREVFPCIDEPEAKAVFQLTLTTNATDVAVSNMPISKEVVFGTRKTTIFEESPIMSTYLLAWVSGDLEYQQSITGNGVQVRAYCTPVHSGKTAFSLKVACKALDYMDEYFGTPYPLKKCDIIALPDFAAGAMENWGCITFRESAMLIDADQSDLGDKQHVANVVTHELAHQWFGNLVTMRWWDDLWLNEGFASWIPYLVLNDIFPQWRLWEQFSTGDLMIGLRADALENTHPIVVEIHSPNEIRSAFDSISYDKGCSVINLLFRYIGPESFRDGLRAYLSEHAYGNAETADLWRAWAKSSGKDVEGFMSSWTTKKGFPIIQATTTKDGLQLSQERFFLNHSDGTDQTLWPIPLIQGDGDHTIFDTKTAEISSTKKLNSGQSGFYRVIYDKAAIESILSAEPSPIDMLGLINDASEAAKAGYHSTTEALDLIRTVSTSENEPLMGTSLGELASIRTVLSSTFDAMKPFVGTFIQSNYKRLGIEKKKHDTVDDELLRPMILGAASYSGYDAVVLWALETFAEAKTPEDILPDMRAVVYHTAVRERGNSKTYEKLLAWYNANTIPGEQVNIANALTSFKDEDHIKRTLTYITTENVKLQDSLYWIAYSLVGRHSKHLAWKWLQQNWEWIGENFGKEKEIDYYLRYAANGFATVKHLKEYEEFFSSVDIYGSKRAFEQGRETIAWQTAWRSRDEQSVVDWLKHA